MRNSKSHTLTVKMKLSKCKTIFHAYNVSQLKYGEALDKRADIQEIRANVPIDCELGNSYTTDFYCIKTDGSIMVRECVFFDKLTTPRTCAMMDASRNYWYSKGVKEWGIVVFVPDNIKNKPINLQSA